MLGFFNDERRARLNLNITDNAGAAGAEPNRRLEIEFVLPGKRLAEMEALEPPRPTSSLRLRRTRPHRVCRSFPRRAIGWTEGLCRHRTELSVPESLTEWA